MIEHRKTEWLARSSNLRGINEKLVFNMFVVIIVLKFCVNFV